MNERTGITFNIQRLGTEDRPGIRTTVFFKGCPLRRAWCHNPDGLNPGLELIVRASSHCAYSAGLAQLV